MNDARVLDPDDWDVEDDTEIVLDISRLISRVLHPTPTGVDRVEMAYAQELQRRAPDRLRYGALHPAGVYGRVPDAVARRFMDAAEVCWRDGGQTRHGPARNALHLARTLASLWPRRVPRRSAGRRVYLQSSPHHLDRESVVRTILRREDAGFVCLLHDLIPIEYPEYARPGGDRIHVRRVMTVARLADAVIANSEATRRSFLPYLERAGRDIPVEVAHLGVNLPSRVTGNPHGGHPYFVCLGTIEPRKNHLLLLHIWRNLAEKLGPATPRLIIIGRRGWENEQVVDLLERCPALVGLVEERAGLSDALTHELLANARALLLPSFAEGYGIPVPEALSLGVPVLCSDLPALREAGGSAPCYLDPLDGPSWQTAILGLADGNGEARARHVARISGWRAPTWDDHITTVLAQIRRVATA